MSQEGARVVMCARDATLLENAARTVRERAVAGEYVLAQPADVATPSDCDALVGVGARALCARRRSGQQRRRLRARWARSRTSTGPTGCRRSRSICWARCCCAARCCRTSSDNAHGKIIQLSGGGATNPLPLHQRLCGVQGGGRALHRNAGRGGPRRSASTSTPSRPAR